MAIFYKQFKSYAAQHGNAEALALKAVLVLPGVDHSDFCPGFFVTKIDDLCPEVPQDVALQSIGKGAAAFLHLNSPTSNTTKAAALGTLKDMLSFSVEMFEPYLEAFKLESSGAWCETAQRKIAGLAAADIDKLQIKLDVVAFNSFEHAHTNYSQLPQGGLVVNTISTFEPATGFGPSDVHGAAKSIDCKMVGADRIAQQMNVSTDMGVACRAVNAQAVATALKLLPQKSLKRFQSKGRTVCLKDDTSVFENIGPLFVKGSITLKETSPCLEVASLGLVSTVSSHIFPGNHYCKLLSPAMAMEWMMTESLRPYPYNLNATACGSLHEEILV